MAERENRPPQKHGLGRGLDALLAPVPAAPSAPMATQGDPYLREIIVHEIHPNPDQPRQLFDPESMTALAQSIAEHGVLQPIVVEPAEEGYLLIAGERRWRASQAAGLPTIPALVRPVSESRRHALEIALTENLAREELSPLEEASAFARLADVFGMSHDAIARRVGRSRAAVSNTLRLLKLPAEVQLALDQQKISAGHARALLALEEQAAQLELLAQIEARGLSVRDTERRVAQYQEKDSRQNKTPAGTTATGGVAAANKDDALIRRLEETLGVPVTIERKKTGGRLLISFYSDEDLGSLYDRLGGPPL